MSRALPSCSALVVACLLAIAGSAAAQPMDDMCSTPKMKTDKWQSRTEVGGMRLLIPPGFTATGHSDAGETQDSHFYVAGEHRLIGVGSGRGPAFVRSTSVSETGECETVIAGRRVVITLYHWVNEDAQLSASGDAGAHFAAIARFYATGALREVYVSLESNAPSDVKYYRQLFWTVSFDGAEAQQVASVTSGAVPITATPASAGSAPAAAAPPPPCAATPQPGLPAADAVLDSATVGQLLSSAAPIPPGFEVMSLQFDGTGELAGLSVAQSDLPEASQRELSTVVATNLKPHDAHAPSTFLLRIDAAAAGLHYSVLPAGACGP